MTRQEKLDYINSYSENKFSEQFKNLPDEALENFYQITKLLRDNTKGGKQEARNKLTELMLNTISDSDKNSPIVEEYINIISGLSKFSSVLTKDEYNKICKLMEESCPTDSIYLTRESDLKIQSFWKEYNKEAIEEDGSYHVPSDLVLANTIPLPDIIIEINGKNSDVADGNDIYCRIKIFDEKNRITDNYLYDIVGAIAIKSTIPGQTGIVITCPIIIFNLTPDNLTGKVGLSNHELLNKRLEAVVNDEEALQLQIQAIGLFLSTWYGVQLAMLHPIIKEVFSKGQRLKQRAINQLIKTSGEQAKNKCKYIKYHRIEDPNFEEESYNKMGYTFERKTMIWWVCGHYRNRQGKKEFVKGYWKGPLRELKTLTEAREREIAQLEEG